MQRRWQVLTLVSVATFVASLDLFIVNIAFPDIGADFGGASVGELSWVLNAYAIVFAALLVPAGRLADRAGRRRGFLAGLALFVVGSALCGLAPSVAPRRRARVLQAAGAALLVPTSLALLLPEFEPREREAAIGIWAGSARRRGRGGPPVGGLLVEVDWRLVFLVNLPVGAWALWRGAPAADRDARRGGAGVARLDRRRAVRGRDRGAGARASCRRRSGAGATRGRSPRWRAPPPRSRCSRGAARANLPRRRPGDAARPLVRAGQRGRDPVLGGVRRDAALQRALPDDGVDESILRAGLQLAPGPALAAVAAVGLEPVHQPGRPARARGRLHALRVGDAPRRAARRRDARLRDRAAPRAVPHRHRRRPHAAEPQQRGRLVAAAGALRDRRRGAHDVAPARIALGVAVLVAVLGTPAPGAVLDAFQAGWTFQIVAALLGALAGLAIGVVAPAPAVELVDRPIMRGDLSFSRILPLGSRALSSARAGAARADLRRRTHEEGDSAARGRGRARGRRRDGRQRAGGQRGRLGRGAERGQGRHGHDRHPPAPQGVPGDRRPQGQQRQPRDRDAGPRGLGRLRRAAARHGGRLLEGLEAAVLGRTSSRSSRADLGRRPRPRRSGRRTSTSRRWTRPAPAHLPGARRSRSIDFVEPTTSASTSSAGCGRPTSRRSLAGKVAVIQRGTCDFGLKAKNARPRRRAWSSSTRARSATRSATA